MSINTASPQETYDHMLGSGALQWDWWRGCTITGAPEGKAADDWSVTLTAEDGETGGDKVATFGHKEVIATARKAMTDPPKYASQAMLRECSHLIFDNGVTDFDASSADELLQFIVLGEIVYS